ncbi:MAG: terpene cyclase/mutase family protein, partial [Planctomycetes bacterium]|nr:terpene cyclase/mutase family protein [Planctomycetota bacterium]
MRRWLLVTFVLWPVVEAQDGERRAAALAQARRDLQAQLEVADMLLERGDVEAAELAYRKAMEKFAAALGGAAEPARPAPRPVPKLEPEDPALRAEEATRVAPVFGRRGAKGVRNMRAGGGSGLTENAVNLGLEWLAKHQDEDGRWDSEGFMKHDPVRDRCDGSGDPQFDAGVTGLALLAFLGAGHTDDGGPYADNVRRGLHFLVASRAEDGWIATADPSIAIYEHAIAAAALSEAYGMTRSPRARDAAQRAVNVLQRARNPNAGWRYASNGENDTSVTAWCTLALHAARTAGLDVDPEAFKGARAWVENATEPNFGQVGYVTKGGPVATLERHRDRFPPEKSYSMTAAGIFIRIVAGEA